MGYSDCNTVAAPRVTRYDASQRWWAAPEAKPARRHRERKPNIRTLIRAAEKEGKNVTSVTVNGVTLTFGAAGTEPKSETDRELEEFNGRHG